MTITIDSQTLHLLEHQGRRMHWALHETTPPDRAEAARIQSRVDDILDRRPRPIAVASDGEVLWAGQSRPWVAAQGIPVPEPALAKPVTPEPVLPIDTTGDDLGDGPGGVAVLDREKIRDAEPGDGRQRDPLTQAEIDRFGKELDL